jgi:PPM family protein phosphatase
MKNSITAQTDTGVVRANNEDAISQNSKLGIAVLADGMGGHNAGEVASQQTVENILKGIEEYIELLDGELSVDLARSQLKLLIARQNSDLFYQASTVDAYEGMGCTLVVIWLIGAQALVANVGDSRCYHCRDGLLVQITRDHSFAQFQLDHGLISEEDVRTGQVKNQLLRAMGTESKVSPDFFTVDLQANDLLLSCSDGITECLNNETLQDKLIQFASSEQLEKELVNAAIEAGGTDNISVQIVRIGDELEIHQPSSNKGSQNSKGFFKRLFKTRN